MFKKFALAATVALGLGAAGNAQAQSDPHQQNLDTNDAQTFVMNDEVKSDLKVYDDLPRMTPQDAFNHMHKSDEWNNPKIDERISQRASEEHAYSIGSGPNQMMGVIEESLAYGNSLTAEEQAELGWDDPEIQEAMSLYLKVQYEEEKLFEDLPAPFKGDTLTPEDIEEKRNLRKHIQNHKAQIYETGLNKLSSFDMSDGKAEKLAEKYYEPDMDR